MLQAVAKRKDRNSFKPFEDVVTSCVFGPLSYLPVEQVWGFFKKLIPDERLWPNVVPDRHEFHFWKNIAESGRVEPDLIVRFFDNYNNAPLLTLLIEIKWKNSSLYPDQLEKQWNCIPKAEQGTCIHLCLVKDTASAKKEIAEYREERLFCTGWLNLAETMHDHFPPPSDSWASDVRAFLQRIGVTAFGGFAHLPDPDIMSIGTPPFFWREYPWFSFLEERNLPEDIFKTSNLFWKETV
jgi:hypothetical protein